MSRRAWLSQRSERGVTLLELLVVIGIILAITAAVIPVMAPAMAGRRLREASRGVNTFISSARNKALATGRSVGVAFERLEAEPQASTVLSLVEVPPPWAGDNANSRIQIGLGGRITGFEFGDIGWQIARIRPGDLIKLNHRNTTYRIFAGEAFHDADQDGVEQGEFVDLDGNGGYTEAADGDLDPKFGHFVRDPSAAMWTIGYDDPRMSSSPVRLQPGYYSFQIIRQPVRSSSATFQLPVGTIVDLSMSGDDSFVAATRARFARAVDPNANPPELPETRPVVIAFAPNGALDRVWLPVQGSSNIDVFRPTAGIQFLVGRRDGVGLGPQDVLSTPVDELPNWRDLENFWVSVNAQSGTVLSNPNAQVATDLQVRSGTTATDDTNISLNGVTMGLGQARAFARQGQSMGGR